jgi:cytochrome c
MIKSVLAAAVLLAGFMCPASAQTGSPGEDVRNGARLAGALCSNCHDVGTGTAERMLADVPGFAEIASRPGASAERLENFILVPHPAMPEVQLSRDELADIVAYILSLKSP